MYFVDYWCPHQNKETLHHQHQFNTWVTRAMVSQPSSIVKYESDKRLPIWYHQQRHCNNFLFPRIFPFRFFR